LCEAIRNSFRRSFRAKIFCLRRAAGRGPPAGVDVIFPVLHGTFGEDGTIQGLLDLAGIPYVGAGVLGSAAGMDKDAMKRLFRDDGLPVVEWLLVLRREWKQSPARLRKLMETKLGYPLFIKPANLGSSVGISKVHNHRELGPAIDLAAGYDRKVIVEKGSRRARLNARCWAMIRRRFPFPVKSCRSTSSTIMKRSM